MPIIIDINKDVLVEALEQKISTHKRNKNNNKSPSFAAVYDKEIATLQTAIASIQNTK